MFVVQDHGNLVHKLTEGDFWNSFWQKGLEKKWCRYTIFVGSSVLLRQRRGERLHVGNSYTMPGFCDLETSSTHRSLCHKDLHCVPGRIPDSLKIKNLESCGPFLMGTSRYYSSRKNFPLQNSSILNRTNQKTFKKKKAKRKRIRKTNWRT